jgi:integrase
MQELSENTQRMYTTYVNIFQKWLDGRKPNLKNGEAFLESLREKGAKRNTIGVAGRALRRILKIPVAVPSIEMLEPRYLLVDDVRKMIDMAPTLLEKTILTLLFSTACRISEVLNLTMKDLELDNEVATVTRKGGRRERIALGKQGTEALRTWLEQRVSKTNRVFMDYNYNNIYYRLKQVAAAAGFPDFTPHITRHSRVRHLKDSGRDWPDISEVCGHTSVTTTVKIYGRHKAEERSALLADF